MNTRKVNTSFNSASVRKPVSIQRQIRNSVNNKKGLRVVKCIFNSGWDIELPNGIHHHVNTDGDMIRYVKDY